ncbi:MAG: hypothetical protein CSB55_06395 [Candidatus Cloacimonadota bacterium]|nr:MAG: hypothetical protein CSB55_06395 [Candidatus Cloacimonadota bacterium]
MRRIIELLLFFSISLLSGFDKDENLSDRPYKLVHADSLEVVKIDSAYVTCLVGDVHFFYGNTEFFSEYAGIFEAEKIVELENNVVILEDTLRLESEKVTYFRKDEIIRLLHNVNISQTCKADSSYRTFHADSVDYYREKGDVFASGDIKVFDSKEKMRGSCGEMKYNLESGYGFMIKNPHISKKGKDSLDISSEKMEFFRNYNKIAALFNVKLYNEIFSVTSNYLIYFSDTEEALFRGNPMLQSEKVNGFAKEFRLYFNNNEITKAVFKDSSEAYFKIRDEAEKESFVLGDEIKIDFIEQKASFCEAKNNVKTKLIQTQTKKNEFFINKLRCKRLTLNLNEDNTVRDISVNDARNGIYIFNDKKD